MAIPVIPISTVFPLDKHHYIYFAEEEMLDPARAPGILKLSDGKELTVFQIDTKNPDRWSCADNPDLSSDEIKNKVRLESKKAIKSFLSYNYRIFFFVQVVGKVAAYIFSLSYFVNATLSKKIGISASLYAVIICSGFILLFRGISGNYSSLHQYQKAWKQLASIFFKCKQDIKGLEGDKLLLYKRNLESNYGIKLEDTDPADGSDTSDYYLKAFLNLNVKRLGVLLFFKCMACSELSKYGIRLAPI